MTKVYGCSDDLVEIEGDVRAEFDALLEEDTKGLLLSFSDGTVLAMKYCLNFPGVWGARVYNKGSLFKEVEVCTDSEAKVYSDVVSFWPGITNCWAAKEWESAK